MMLPGDITLQSGDSGDYVGELQRRLAQRDLLGDGNISNLFDGPTTQAVMQFQTINGLRTDGVAGPETLRRLVSIGGSEGDASSGGNQSEEEEKAEFVNPEMADEYALAAEQEEHKKLENEAVWGYGEEAAAEQTQGQQQLSDLDRYNQQHDQQTAQALEIEAIARDQMVAMQGDAQAEHLEQQEQLKVDQQGVKAHTLAEEMERPPEHEAPDQALDQQREPPAQDASIEQLPDAPLHAAPEQEVPVQEAQPIAMADARDPELVRTEAQLDSPSRQESTAEGHNLEKKGIQNRGNVPEQELGGLTPDSTPGKAREREMAR